MAIGLQSSRSRWRVGTQAGLAGLLVSNGSTTMDDRLARLSAVAQTSDDLAASVLNACAELARIGSDDKAMPRRGAGDWQRRALHLAGRHSLSHTLNS